MIMMWFKPQNARQKTPNGLCDDTNFILDGT